MNKLAPINYITEDMLAILDGQIDQALHSGKSPRSAIKPFLNMLLHDSALQRSFVAWAIDARVEQRNAGDADQAVAAKFGLPQRAASPALNEDGFGQRGSANTGQLSTARSSSHKGDEDGHPSFASNGHCAYAASSSPNGGGVGQVPDASSPNAGAAPSPNRRDTNGHSNTVTRHNEGAVSYREPSTAELKGRLSAKFRVAERILTSLDTYSIGGKPIGDLTFAEARAALEDKVEKSTVLRQVLRHAANVSPNQLVREVVKPTDLDEMIRKAKELVDVA